MIWLILAGVALLIIGLLVIMADDSPDGSDRLRAISFDGAPNGKKIVQYKCRFGWAHLNRGPFPGLWELAIYTDIKDAKRFASTVREYGIAKWTGMDKEGKRLRYEMEFAEYLEKVEQHAEVEL